MRSRIGLFALLVITLAVGGLRDSIPAQPGTILEPNDRVTVGLNVRAEPRADAEIVAVLRPGDRVTETGSVPYWYSVRLEDGTEGWAAKGYLRVVAETQPAPVAGVNLADLRVHFIDVGVGDAILIDYGDKEILIDGGNWATIAYKYVKDLIQDPVELVIVTHGTPITGRA